MTVQAVGSSGSTQNAFGLDFQSLLQIILTQLTYQDPLKPMDNFEFVSQLAQFSQLQQTQTLSDNVASLLSSQSLMQSTGLLGKTVDFSSSTASSGTVSGVVSAVAFSNGTPTITIKASDGSTVTGLSPTQITQVRN